MRVQLTLRGQNNITNEFSTTELLRVQLFGQIKKKIEVWPSFINGRGHPTPRMITIFVCQDNVKNQVSTIKLNKVQISSKSESVDIALKIYSAQSNYSE